MRTDRDVNIGEFAPRVSEEVLEHLCRCFLAVLCFPLALHR